MAKEIFCSFGVHADAVAGWIGTYGGENSPADISRGLFAGEVGSPRLLKLFDRFGIKTTWYIPGHTIETFPEQMQAVAEAGHEMGIHGYTHENPDRHDAAAGRGCARQVHRAHHRTDRQAPDRLCRAVVGIRPASHGLLMKKRHQIRPQPAAQRLPALLSPRRAIPGPRLTIPESGQASG